MQTIAIKFFIKFSAILLVPIAVMALLRFLQIESEIVYVVLCFFGGMVIGLF